VPCRWIPRRYNQMTIFQIWEPGGLQWEME
jgi:hypothetical protein